MKTRLLTLLVVVAVVLAMVLTGCTPKPPVTPPAPDPVLPGPVYGGVLSVGWAGEPNTLDLHKSGQAAAFRLLMAIHEPLTWVDSSGKIHPGLAERWDISTDGMTYTLYLKEGVKFHDGTPVNAEAVKFNWDRIMDPATKAQSAKGFLGTFEGSEVLGEYTLKVKMRTPYAPFIRHLSTPGLAPVSPTALAAMGDDAFARKPIGAGPFMVKEWVSGSHLHLVKNPDYDWASEFHEHSGPAYLDELTFYFISEEQVRYSALTTGEIQVVDGIPAFHVSDLQAQPDKYSVLIMPTPGISLHSWINSKKFPTDDINVRKAINHAYDAQGMITTVMNNTSLYPNGPLAAHNWASTSEYRDAYGFDQAKAVQLLEASGWVLGSDGIRVKGGQRLVLDSMITPGYVENIMEYIQADFREVGIELKINVLAASAWSASNFAGGHNLTTGGVWRTDPDLLRLAFHSKLGTFAWSFMEDPEFEALLEAALAEVDTEKRKEMYAQAQSILTEFCPTLPLLDPTTRFATLANIGGIVFEENASAVFYGAHYIE